MTILVTGAAGFIGFHISQTLLKRGHDVVGIDNLNTYYDLNLKKARLDILNENKNFKFFKVDVQNTNDLQEIFKQNLSINYIVHLAAQAGVRYSLENPYAYINANVMGHLNILEASKLLPNLKHLVYASSSSVYGANEKLPFSVEDRVDTPISLYAATKKSCELMSYCYSHLFKIPTTGLRYFTVYGPWGRPDMSAFIFTDAILNGKEMAVFNNGEMRRNYTYIDDIVEGTLSCLEKSTVLSSSAKVPHSVYNIGNNKSENLMDFIMLLEKHLDKKAKMRFEPLQPGDVKETIADISNAQQDFGFLPKTSIDKGIPEFIHWYKKYYNASV
jgi:UDP-glucuronate 4-epimerase